MSTTKSDLESWQSVSAGEHFIKRLDHRGELTKDERIAPGKTFHVTQEERRINSEMAAEASLDVFRNGFFQPVRLLDDSEEARELASNPNLLSESDMKALVKGHHKTFEAKLAGITNSTTLRRMVELARTEDASVRRVEMIQARLEQVEPSRLRIPGRDREPRAVTPR